jgi:hypothetical protein
MLAGQLQEEIALPAWYQRAGVQDRAIHAGKSGRPTRAMISEPSGPRPAAN